MNILVLNGSPKGENSITLQTVRFWEILYPEHKFTVLHAGQKIRSFERDFTEAAAAIEQAEILLFSYPVYTFIAPCQLPSMFPATLAWSPISYEASPPNGISA